MNIKLQKKLSNKYSFMDIYIECGDGWYNIIDNLLSEFDKEDNSEFSLFQIKEKFGLLRVYISSGTDKMYDDISKAEKESASTCEYCGKKGKQKEIRGWIKTICKKCEGSV